MALNVKENQCNFRKGNPVIIREYSLRLAESHQNFCIKFDQYENEMSVLSTMKHEETANKLSYDTISE